MQSYQSTTPFGRRALSLAHIAGETTARERPPELSVNKWTVLRNLSRARAALGLSERSLMVLDALLSFFPKAELSGAQLIVFPSNDQLSLRAHGMAPATLRRHLAVLVLAGLIVRRDSPNGKRYARKDGGGEVREAFGFDLSPLVTRADEFAGIADALRASEQAMKRQREAISLCRRDIAKMIETAVGEGIAFGAAIEGCRNWSELHGLFRRIIEALPRNADLPALEEAAARLARLAASLHKRLEDHVKSIKSSASESQSEQHKQNSKPDDIHEFEPGFRESTWGKAEPSPDGEAEARPPVRLYPLSLVLKACPDIQPFAGGDIRNWQEFIRAAERIRPMLGVSPSAWEEAIAALGRIDAAITLAAILQRAESIKSPGAYLRALTAKAEAGQFSLGPVLMALLTRTNTAAA